MYDRMMEPIYPIPEQMSREKSNFYKKFIPPWTERVAECTKIG